MLKCLLSLFLLTDILKKPSYEVEQKSNWKANVERNNIANEKLNDDPENDVVDAARIKSILRNFERIPVIIEQRPP